MAAENVGLPQAEVNRHAIGPLLTAVRAGRLPEGTRVLDIRQEVDFEAGHLRGAYNIPWVDIGCRAFELPARSEPLLVCHEAETAVRERVAAWFDSCTERCRWQAELLPMTTEVLALGSPLVEKGPGIPGRFLFAVSPLLLQSWPLLEALVQKTTALGHQPRALDIGSGSGRDAAVLAAAGWHVTCLDRDARALARCSGIMARHGFHGCCTTVQASLRQAGDLTAALLGVTAVAPAGRDASADSTRWELVTVNRHLHRASLPEMAELLAEHGLLLFHSFMEGNAHPSNEASVLQSGELQGVFSPVLSIVRDEELRIDDGRLLSFFVARRGSLGLGLEGQCNKGDHRGTRKEDVTSQPSQHNSLG